MPEVLEPKFKILDQGTHTSMSIGNTLDQLTPPAEPAIKEEVKEEVAPPAEPAKPEAIIPKTEPAVAEPTPSPKRWDDSLKDEGFDEKFINVAKLYKDTGNLKPYMEALTVDVAKMSPEQILKYNLQKTYPTATAEDLDLLYETEVKDKYMLDEEKYLPETREAKAGRVKMKMDVESLRSKIAEDLNKFQLPSFDREAEVKKQQEAYQAQQRASIDSFYNDDYVKSFVKDKKLVIGNLGAGVPDFNMIAEDPSEITGILTDQSKGLKYVSDKNGNIDRKAQIRVATFAANPEAFCQALINYGKSLGKEELIEEKSNPPKPAGQAASLPKETLNEAIASRGIAGRGR